MRLSVIQGVMLALLLVLVFSMGARVGGPQTLRAERIEIVDEDGRVAMVLTVRDGKPAIEMQTPDNIHLLNLTADGIGLSDQTRSEHLMLSTKGLRNWGKEGSRVNITREEFSFRDEGGAERISARITEGAAVLRLADPKGLHQFGAAAGPNDATVLSIGTDRTRVLIGASEHETSLLLMEDGKIIWQAVQKEDAQNL